MVMAFPAAGYSEADAAGLGGSSDGPLPPIVEESSGGPGASEASAPPPGSDGDAVKVVVRVRPPLPRELQGYRPFQNAALPDPNGRVVTLSENLAALQNNGVENGLVYSSYRFGFDRVYGPEASQEEVYAESARSAVHSVLNGYNASIVAYGQTGTGKTFTMEGEHTGPNRGIIPRSIEDVFSYIQRDTGERCKFLVRASYLQIYNEVISDLLKPDATNLVVREDRRRGVHVEGLSEWVVRSPAEVYSLMERGAAARTTGATKLNEISSRSHAIFMLIVEKSSLGSTDGGRGGGAAADGLDAFRGLAPGMGRAASAGGGDGMQQSVRVGKLNLVDLAGSERVHVTGATGKRLEESKKINQSLSALGNVIAALTDPKGRDGRPHIPYRDSKLTRILEDSLGGNCRTTFMAMISPAVEAYAESLSTLKFANRAKSVRNLPKVNEDLDHRTLLRRYERELKRLRAELQQRSKDLVDKRLVLQIEEARRREQADKIAAITALERQSQEIARQKAAMATLQSRIASMQSQLLIGGQKVEDTPQFRTLLAREQARIREQYEARLAELESEQRGVAEDRAQAERYKALLLKQRDIMVQLTGRLNERDEQILMLQAEIEAYDGHQRKLEDQLDRKTAEIISLRKLVAAGGGGGAAADEAAQQQIPAAWPEAPGSSARGPQQVPNAWAGDGEGSEAGGSGGSPAPHSASRAWQQQGGSAADAAALAAQMEAMRLQHSREAAALGESELRWRQAAEVLQAQLEEARAATLASSNGAGQAGEDELAAELDAAQERCEALGRERDALRTILETKVGVLVDDVTRSVAELPGGAATTHPKLAKQLGYLQKLVRATVQAMAAGTAAT